MKFSQHKVTALKCLALFGFVFAFWLWCTPSARAQLTGPLQVKRGTVAALPALRAGEPYLATDTGEWYAGTNNTIGGNVLVVARPKISGSVNQTLRFSGANTLAASSALTNDGTNIAIAGALSVSGQTTFGAKINAQNNLLYFAQTYGPPGAGSVGEKIQLYGNVPGSIASDDYALGLEGSYLWMNSYAGFKWYANSTNTMRLDGNGALSLNAQGAIDGVLAITGPAYLSQYMSNPWGSVSSFVSNGSAQFIPQVSSAGESGFRADASKRFWIGDGYNWRAVFETNGNFATRGAVQPTGGYKSSDGTAGASGYLPPYTDTGGHTVQVQVKNGLVVAVLVNGTATALPSSPLTIGGGAD